MSKNQPARGFSPVRAIQKFVVSTFVVCAFLAYAVHEHLVNSDAATSAVAPTTSAAVTQPVPDSLQAMPTAPQAGIPQAAPGPTATTVPPASRFAVAKSQAAPTVKPTGLYKDGAYTGPQVDAYWGTVQVRAIVQNGKIANVQFLKYPSDRRTSVRINTIAIPYLQSETIQAQNANVDVISGATLTSEAFAQSLQAALNTAKN